MLEEMDGLVVFQSELPGTVNDNMIKRRILNTIGTYVWGIIHTRGAKWGIGVRNEAYKRGREHEAQMKRGPDQSLKLAYKEILSTMVKPRLRETMRMTTGLTSVMRNMSC